MTAACPAPHPPSLSGEKRCRRRFVKARSEALAIGQEGVPLARVVVTDALGADGANFDARAHTAAAAGAAVVLGGVAAHLACRSGNMAASRMRTVAWGTLSRSTPVHRSGTKRGGHGAVRTNSPDQAHQSCPGQSPIQQRRRPAAAAAARGPLPPARRTAGTRPARPHCSRALHRPPGVTKGLGVTT